jgi:hypothetical protein
VSGFLKRVSGSTGWSTPIGIARCENCREFFVWRRQGGRSGVRRYCSETCQIEAHRACTEEWKKTHDQPKAVCAEPGCPYRPASEVLPRARRESSQMAFGNLLELRK